jgi:hypothetical protein
VEALNCKQKKRAEEEKCLPDVCVGAEPQSQQALMRSTTKL